MKHDRISKILESIEKLKQELYEEYFNISKKYEFFIKNKKVIFSEKIKKYWKLKKINEFRYFITADIRHIISISFIYSMIIPAMILDLFLTIYQYTVLPLYWIPKVKRDSYFIYDRRFLSYLNLIQKINCLYCSYVNWLFAYAVEIWARTEQYWCPVKHALKHELNHEYTKYYADFWDVDWFNEIFNKNICFKK